MTTIIPCTTTATTNNNGIHFSLQMFVFERPKWTIHFGDYILYMMLHTRTISWTNKIISSNKKHTENRNHTVRTRCSSPIIYYIILRSLTYIPPPIIMKEQAQEIHIHCSQLFNPPFYLVYNTAQHITSKQQKRDELVYSINNICMYIQNRKQKFVFQINDLHIIKHTIP